VKFVVIDKKWNNFRNLGSIISSDGSIDEEMDQRIKIGWMKWKQLSLML
jgi:hypothetical protein